MHEQCNTHFLNSKLVLLMGEEEKKETRQGLTLRVVPNKREEVLGLLLVVKKTVMLIVEGFLGNFSCWIPVGKLAFPPLSFIFIFFITYFFLPPGSHKIHFNQLRHSFVLLSLLGSFLPFQIFFHIFFPFLSSSPSSFITSQLKLTSNTLIFFLSLSWLLSLTSGFIPPFFLFVFFYLPLGSHKLQKLSSKLFFLLSLSSIFSLSSSFLLFFFSSSIYIKRKTSRSSSRWFDQDLTHQKKSYL